MRLLKALNFISHQQPLLIKLHRSLVSLQSINPEHGGKGEEQKANWLEDWLRDNGLCQIQRFDSLDERVPLKLRPNLVAHYNPNQSDITLWIVSHMDTVAVGERFLWQSDPFTLRIDGDFLYGRGVEDNNQAIVSTLLLFDMLKKTNIKPTIGLGMICVSAGLTDHTKGISYVLEKNMTLFSNNDLIIVPDYGNAEGSYIQIAEKKSAWLKVTIQGVEDHAGYEINCNAFEVGALFINQIHQKFASFNQKNSFYHPSIMTITPTHCEISCTGLNHIASHFIFYLDIRLHPEYSLEMVMKKLKALANKMEKKTQATINFDFVEITPDVPKTEKNAPVIKMLKKAIITELGIEPSYIGVGGTTLVSILRSTHLPVAVWSVQTGKKVRANERTSIQGQIKQTKILARLLFAKPRNYITKQGATSDKEINDKITATELKVGTLISQKMSNDEICIFLGVTKNTVRSHIKSLYKKTGCQNRDELVKCYARYATRDKAIKA